MKKPLDLAKRFLSMAKRDIQTFQFLVNSDEMADEAVGFHAQQAVEKCLKCILVLNGIEFRKTHDLAELLTLLKGKKIPLPPHSDVLDELDPYAVILRYDFLEEIDNLDRKKAIRIVNAVFQWTQKQIDS